MTHNIRQQLLNLSIPETEIALLERIAAAPSRRREAKVIAEEIAAGLQASAHRAARLRVEELIRSFFSVEGTDDEDLLAVDKHLRVGVASSFPHTLAGGLVWRFHPKAEADVTVCVGLVPRSHEISEWFLVIRTPKRTISPPLKGSDKRSVYPSLTPAQVKRRLKRTIPWARAAQLLREAIGDDLMFDSGRVARRLGWSTKRALYVYDHLLRAGANLIPCKRRKGRRVTVTCEKCGEQRAMPVSHAVRQTTGLCGRCNDRRKKKRKVKITCGECGAVRFVWPSVAKKYSNGRSTTCHVCTMRRGREITARANAAGRAVKRAARRAMEQILKIVAETISARPDVLHAKARTLQRWDKPQVYWTDLSGDRHRLVIVASDDFLKRCPTLNARSLRRVATALSQPEHWKERPPARKADHSWEVVPPVRAISPRAQKHSRSPR